MVSPGIDVERFPADDAYQLRGWALWVGQECSFMWVRDVFSKELVCNECFMKWEKVVEQKVVWYRQCFCLSLVYWTLKSQIFTVCNVGQACGDNTC